MYNASPEPYTPIRSFSNSTIRSPVAVSPTTPAIDEKMSSFSVISTVPSLPVIARTRSSIDGGSTVGHGNGYPQRPPLIYTQSMPTHIGYDSRPNSPDDDISVPKQNFRALVTNVIQQNREAQAAAPAADHAKDNLTAMPAGLAKARQNTNPMHPFTMPPRRGQTLEAQSSQHKKPRLAAIVPALRTLSTTETLNEHTALVRHLQFSPNGEFCEYHLHVATAYFIGIRTER